MKGKAKAAEFEGEGYKVHVTGRHVMITEAMQAYAIEKVSKIERFSKRIIDVAITMDIQKLEHRVDIVMKVDHIKIKSHASTTDMYVSIDKAVHKIENQLSRYKSRIQDHTSKPTKAVDLKVNVLNRAVHDEIEEVNSEIEAENNRKHLESLIPHQVVSTDTKLLKQLTLDEAVMKMELSGDSFLIYRSEEDRKLKVMYRRKDQHLGVIEVEA